MRISRKYYVACSMGILFIVFALLLTTYYTLPVYAADSTPSADIKAKLEELKKEIASKAAKLKQEIGKKLQNKAYVGKVKTKTTTSLTLGTGTGPKIVTLNQDTIYSLKTLAEEDEVAALGDVDDNGVLTAKKIVLLPTTSLPPKSYLWGQIVSISDKLATLKDRKLKNIALALSPSNVKLNDFVILTGNFNKNDIFVAEFVYVIPQGGFIRPKKIVYPAPTGAGATPSAQPKR